MVRGLGFLWWTTWPCRICSLPRNTRCVSMFQLHVFLFLSSFIVVGFFRNAGEFCVLEVVEAAPASSRYRSKRAIRTSGLGRFRGRSRLFKRLLESQAPRSRFTSFALCTTRPESARFRCAHVIEIRGHGEVRDHKRQGRHNHRCTRR